MSSRTFAVTMISLAVVGLLGFGLVTKGDAAVEVGEPAPDGPLPVLGEEGTAEIADYRGSWVLVNFWASWCPPCRDEAPDLERYWRAHRDDGLVVLGIDTEDVSEDALEFAADPEGDGAEEGLELTYPLVHDGPGERRDDYGISALPESFLVDPEGRIAIVVRGPVDDEFLEEQVTPLLGEGGRSGAGRGSR